MNNGKVIEKRDWSTPLNIPEGKRGEWAIEHVTKEAGFSAETSNLRTAFTAGQEVVKIAFPEETRWHLLTEGEGVWMTDYPIEQAQHDRELQGFSGRVLVGGLGLGYAAQHLAANPDVDEVVVVEKSKEVIDLVAEHLEDPENKIEVVHSDLFDFLRRARRDLRWWHWAFYDIWQSDGESTLHDTVIPLYEASVGVVDNPSHHVVQWNEDVMRGQLALSLQSRLGHLEMMAERLLQEADTAREKLFKNVRMPTLDDLSTYQDDKWIDWSVPFFQAVKARGDIDHRKLAMVYAGIWGLPTWESTWADVLAFPKKHGVGVAMTQEEK